MAAKHLSKHAKTWCRRPRPIPLCGQDCQHCYLLLVLKPELRAQLGVFLGKRQLERWKEHLPGVQLKGLCSVVLLKELKKVLSSIRVRKPKLLPV